MTHRATSERGQALPWRPSRRALLLGVAALATGCDRPAPVSRHTGPARRVVSLSANTTETIFALGAGDRLVGRSRFCDYPPEAKKIPSVGGFVDPSFEAILGLAPDLIVGARFPGGRSTVDRLARRGIPTYFPKTSTMAEIDAMVLGIAKRLGVADRGRALVAKMRARRQEVAEAVRGRRRPRALLLFGLRPIHAAGRGSFSDEMLTIAGGRNVVDEAARFPKLSLERVLALDPDVILDTTMAASESSGLSADMPGWKELRAVHERRLVRIGDEAVLRPGPRVGEGIATIARALHPDVEIP